MNVLSEKRATMAVLQSQLRQKIAAVEAETATDQEVSELQALTTAIENLADEIAALAASNTPPADADTSTQGAKAMTGPAIIKSDKNRVFNTNKFLLALADRQFNEVGYELEMSRECAIKSGKDASVVMLPWGALTKAQDSITASPDTGMSLAKPTSAEDLFTVTSAASFKAGAASQLGVNFYQAIAGQFSVPRMVTPLAPAFVARDANVPNTTGLFDSLNAVPHTLGGMTEVRRSALIDCAPSMQKVISDALMAATMDALDQALLGAKTQALNAPVGLYQLLDSSPTDFGAATPAEMLYNLAAIADLNTDALSLIAGNQWNAYASMTAVNAGLDQQSLLSAMPAAYKRVLSGRMNEFNGTGTAVDPALNLHCFWGPFSTYAHIVLYGGGIALDVNALADSVYARGAILIRTIVDAEVLVRDASRFGMNYNVTA